MILRVDSKKAYELRNWPASNPLRFNVTGYAFDVEDVPDWPAGRFELLESSQKQPLASGSWHKLADIYQARRALARRHADCMERLKHIQETLARACGQQP